MKNQRIQRPTDSYENECPSPGDSSESPKPVSYLPILPPSWLGVLGGGQLGRMFSQAAQRLGYRVAVFESQPDSPAAQVADRVFCPKDASTSTDEPAVKSVPTQGVDGPSLECAETMIADMARLCSVVTVEFENISPSLLEMAGGLTRTSPNVRFLQTCQDRIREKQSIADLGCPTTPFVPISSVSQLDRAVNELGLPLVLKTARSGYDGKGQCIVRHSSELHGAWNSLGSDHLIAEKWIDFRAEVSMITARNAQGQVVHYPLLENEHVHHILDITKCPVRSEFQSLQTQAEQICRRVAEAFEVVGIFCIEFFVDRNGDLMVNEIAPRPHNSGHLTIEAFDISQFEMQVRAICNLPLRTPVQLCAAAMVNLLGDQWAGGTPNWSAVLQQPQTYLHLYGKSEARIGRKMGHITVVDPQNADSLVRQARQSLREPAPE